MSAHGAVDILLVEDNPNDVELTLRALKKNYMLNTLIHLKDGEEALEYLFARGKYEGRDMADIPRIMLLDLKLPKIDGLEVLRAVKADPRTRMTPIIVLTTSKDDRDIAECYSLGVNSYIVKPVEFETFSRVVNELGYYWLLINQKPCCPHPPRT